MSDGRHRLIRTVEWLPVSTPPEVGERVLVWGNGAARLSMLDAQGNWRTRWGGPFRMTPKFWMPIPDGPSDEELAPGRGGRRAHA
jgi:hypothetical protein